MKEVKKHHKHAVLTKPLGGEYHRQEWAIIGAPCNEIELLASELSRLLSPELKVGYLDAAHNAKESDSPFDLVYSDNISGHGIEFKNEWRQKNSRKYFNHLDVLLVNGNHFKADKQIVVLHERKKDSLNRKLDRLTDIRAVVKSNKDSELYDFLSDLMSDKAQILEASNLVPLMRIIKEDLEVPLNGLVLSGGKSQRMGRDKGNIAYHGKPHREYMADILEPFCSNVLISLRDEQKVALSAGYESIKDSFSGLGPYGGILSAMRHSPNSAWLSVACDQPFIEKRHIDILVEGRNPSKLATCFHNPETDFPEPLLTIWEPRAYPVLLEFLSQGYACPRKVLINSDIELLPNPGGLVLVNANTPEEFSKAEMQLKKGNESI